MKDEVHVSGGIRFRPAARQDLEFILAAEGEARRQGFVGGWLQAEHLKAMNSSDVGFWIVEAGERPVGFVIVRGLEDPNQNVELKRLVIAENGRGYGREALRLARRIAFERAAAHRFWLEVFEDNARARGLYEAEGFVVEGALRECIWRENRRATLVIMSQLEQEYRARR